MRKLIIKNVGPIKEVEIDLNKINVFMGPQSSGKSTIAKIISHCAWIEKDIATSQSLNGYKSKEDFKKSIEVFHKMKGYFRSDSYISYSSEVLKLVYSNSRNITVKWVDKYSYCKSKISYIPAERNIVILPEMEKVEFSHNNIRSFLFDWFDARKNYQKDNLVNLLNLGVNYYYNENIRENRIVSNEYDILLDNASSGLQSITPMIVMVEYLANWIYDNEESLSFEEIRKREKVQTILLDEIILPPSLRKQSEIDKIQYQVEFVKNLDKKNVDAIGKATRYNSVKNNLFKTKQTQFIIEEPEQNLFPETQRDLMYYFLEKVSDAERDHELILTTHSPYILYALNNCMMGYLVKDKMSEEEFDKLSCKGSILDPSLVSIAQIVDGELVSIQGEDGLIGNNYFDSVMKGEMNDFYAMINYYGDED